jgi:hypothetical protein
VIQKHRLPASARHLVPIVFVLGVIAGPFVGLLHTAFMATYLGVLATYALLVLTFSVHEARKNGWDIMPLLPAVFATYHISYGVGFLMGIISFVFLRRPGLSETSTAFTTLSR